MYDNQHAKHALSPRQTMFALEYLKDLNATQAAIRAGYSTKTANEQGCRLLANVNIRKAVTAKQVEHAKKVNLSVDHVIAGLLREAESVAEDSTQSARVAAWAHLGKYLGMFTDKIAVDTSMEVRKLSDDELLSLQTALLAKIGVRPA